MQLQHIKPLLLLFIFFYQCIPNAQAQYDKEIFHWESHLPNQIGKQITQSDQYIFYASAWSIIRIDKEELSGSFYSKVEGLSEVGIAEITYDKQGEQLVVAYSSGNIDFVQEDGRVINIADFKQNTTFIDKEINKLIVGNKRRLLYATRFGVVSQDLDTYLYEFTTSMDVEINELAVKDDRIFAASAEGIYMFEEIGVANPGDFTQWKLLEGVNGLPAIYDSRDIELFNGKLYALVDNAIYSSDNGDFWTLERSEVEDFDYVFLSAEGKHLLIGRRFDFTSEIDAIDVNGQFIPYENSCAASMRDAIETPEGEIWYADNWHGMRHQLELNGECQSEIRFNSPYSQKAREIRVQNSQVYIASGGINENFLFDSNRDGVYAEIDGDWKNYNGNTISDINANNMLNFVVCQPHPSKNIIYAGAFPGGMLKIDRDADTTFVYDSESSPLMGTSGALDLERIVEIQFDENENLWVVTYNADEPLHVLTPEGIWYNFSFGNIKNLGAIEFDDYGKLWIQLAGASGGVLVFDHKNSFGNPGDHDFVKFNNSNTVMTSNRVLSLQKDLDGEMWVGTQEGPVVFECGDIFPAKNCTGTIRKFVQDSIPAPLLATEAITSIAVDGANRKWLGSTTGIYVQSPNAEIEVLRLTSDNSPLFDNSIIDIEYDDILGEMYIATSKGVQSIRIDATGANQFFKTNNLYTFPNPVRPDWNGLIGIQGLARDANIKITDMQGRLVHETTAKGGLATWDGFDYSGNRAKAGVYIVYASYIKNLDEITTETTKFLIME